jgi:exodeoxyribonuclease-1
MVITGLTPQDVTDPALPSYFEFARTVRSLVQKWTPATWVGYNTIKFDETFLRQMFYQTLQPDLYETQFNGNDRLDIMLAIQSVWVYEPLVLDWPEDNMGNPILKLDQLAPLNGFTEHDAHDALGDVRATLHIARLIRQRSPQLWDRILANRNKHDVAERLGRHVPMDLVLRYKGPPRICRGCLCGYSTENANTTGFFDLEQSDPADFVDADDETLAKAMSHSPKIIRSVAINGVPNLFESSSNDPILSERAALIEGRPDFQKRVGRVLAARFKDLEPAEDRPVETKIYEGFYSGPDKALLRQFQKADWAGRASIVDQLSDVRLQQLGRRLVVFNNPDGADPTVKAAALSYLNQKWHATLQDKPNWTSFASAERDLEEIEAKQQALPDTLTAWRAFYADREQKLASGELA